MFESLLSHHYLKGFCEGCVEKGVGEGPGKIVNPSTTKHNQTLTWKFRWNLLQRKSTSF